MLTFTGIGNPLLAICVKFKANKDYGTSTIVSDRANELSGEYFRLEFVDDCLLGGSQLRFWPTRSLTN